MIFLVKFYTRCPRKNVSLWNGSPSNKRTFFWDTLYIIHITCLIWRQSIASMYNEDYYKYQNENWEKPHMQLLQFQLFLVFNRLIPIKRVQAHWSNEPMKTRGNLKLTNQKSLKAIWLRLICSKIFHSCSFSR